MARYIDADALIDFIRNLPKEPNGFSKSYDKSAIVRFVENQMWKEAEEVCGNTMIDLEVADEIIRNGGKE